MIRRAAMGSVAARLDGGKTLPFLLAQLAIRNGKGQKLFRACELESIAIQ
jgi:hypothetical protein